VNNRDLVISQLLTPQAFFLPVGLAFVIFRCSWRNVGVHRHRQRDHLR
jgi:putative membrane protein